jgi:hypothetical protein
MLHEKEQRPKIRRMTHDTAAADIIKSMDEMGEPTLLGKMATEKRIYEGKSKNIRPHKELSPEQKKKRLVKELESYRNELDWFFTPKSKNVFDRDPREVAIEAIYTISKYLRHETSYSAAWINDLIDTHWRIGRTTKHSYEKRVRCCLLIEFLIEKGMTQRQAFIHADKIYDFNGKDAKDSYRYFSKNSEKYRFQKIIYKKYAQIFILLDIIENGEIFISLPKNRKVPKRMDNAAERFESIFKNAVELLQKEIELIKKGDLEKLGFQITSVMIEFINREYVNIRKFVSEIQKDPKITWQFVYDTRNFLYDLELYHQVK